MKTLNLTTQAALLLNDRTLVDGNTVYQISCSTFKRNNERVLEQMSVDAFTNDEWDADNSYTYEENDVIVAEHDSWLKLI